MRWRALFQHKERLQPGLLAFAPVRDINPTVCAAQHRTNAHDDHFLQVVTLRRPSAVILDSRKRFLQRHLRLSTNIESRRRSW
jgi:hypothetical protein